MCSFTCEFPLSIGAVHIQPHGILTFAGEVELSAFFSLRLVDDIARLVVEWEPRDVELTMSYGQLELAIPNAQTARENLYVILFTACSLFLGAEITQPCHSVKKMPTERLALSTRPNHFKWHLL